MEKPRFNIPEKNARWGRIFIFLCSVAAVSYLLVCCSRDYEAIFKMHGAESSNPAGLVFTMASVINTYWWAVAGGTLIITFIFYLLSKSGTIYTLLSIIVWLAGAGAYALLWISSSAIDKSTGG